ncbi:unnamed protein product [Orchesella dallaii]|uniref:Phlebovirus glycoprotein G2 fusion domain-containing protein n=1 Tax=Orchesella dallaii TaxID=48710 RepID=A0ABP1RK36_9HEXA
MSRKFDLQFEKDASEFLLALMTTEAITTSLAKTAKITLNKTLTCSCGNLSITEDNEFCICIPPTTSVADGIRFALKDEIIDYHCDCGSTQINCRRDVTTSPNSLFVMASLFDNFRQKKGNFGTLENEFCFDSNGPHFENFVNNIKFQAVGTGNRAKSQAQQKIGHDNISKTELAVPAYSLTEFRRTNENAHLHPFHTHAIKMNTCADLTCGAAQFENMSRCVLTECRIEIRTLANLHLCNIIGISNSFRCLHRRIYTTTYMNPVDEDNDEIMFIEECPKQSKNKVDGEVS